MTLDQPYRGGFVGAEQEGRRRVQAEPRCRLEVHDEIEVSRLHHRKFTGLRAFQDFADIEPRLLVHPSDAWAVAEKCPSHRELPHEADDG